MLIVARHGATSLNDRELLGRQPAGLSERGIAEAGALAEWLDRRYRVVEIHASDLPRAAQTAAIVAGALGIASVRESPLLAERDLGRYEGIGREELLAQRRRLGVSLTSPTQDWHGFDDVEADAGVWDRFGRFARDSGVLRQARSADVLVVTHAGVIRSCLHQSFRIPPDRPRCFRVRTGHALAFAIEEDGLELHQMWHNESSYCGK